MTTIWKSAKKTETNNTFSGAMLSSWSRQQKLAMIAGFAILGLLLAVSACSKQSPKSALVGVSSAEPTPASVSTPMPVETTATQPVVSPAQAITRKKVKKIRPTNVTYSDPNSGVSFLYPRKFALASADKAEPQSAGIDAAPMNFVQPGGIAVATVSAPNTLYPGTDLTSGFFTVNVNRSLSAEECQHFAFVDASDADGEPIDAQKVKVGATDMEMTSEFEGNATKQMEAQYYHNYENGACYEYVLGLNTAGYGTRQGVQPVNRDEVFARLQKIMATVKTRPVAQPLPAEQPSAESTVAVAGATTDQTSK